VTTSEIAYKRYKNDGLETGHQEASGLPLLPIERLRELSGCSVSFVGQPHGDRRHVITFLTTQELVANVMDMAGVSTLFTEMVEMFNRSKIN